MWIPTVHFSEHATKEKQGADVGVIYDIVPIADSACHRFANLHGYVGMGQTGTGMGQV